MAGINPGSNQIFPVPPPAWLLCTPNFLICGLEKPDHFMSGGTDRAGIGYKAGIWLVPASTLE